jgi:hypothetical protein
MTTPQLALADELAAIRSEIARLRSRERALASIEHNFPKVPVFRRSSPPKAMSGPGRTAMTAAHA